MRGTDEYGFKKEWISPAAQRDVYRKFASSGVYGKDGDEYYLSHLAADARFRGRLVAALLRFLKPGDRVLSIAEGAGHLMRALIRKGIRDITGIDICEELVRLGEKKGLDLREASATRLPFEKGSFTAAVINESIGAIGLTEALSEARRVLKAGGRILITNYNYTEDRGHDTTSAVVKYRYIPKEIIARALKNKKFTNISFEAVPIRMTKQKNEYTGDLMDIIVGLRR